MMSNVGTRYLGIGELKTLAVAGKISKDLLEGSNIGISPISDLLVFLEGKKSETDNYLEIRQYAENVVNSHERGHIHIPSLDQDNVGDFFDEDGMFEAHFDKASNPYELIRLVSLVKLNENSFWDESIYDQSIL